MVLIKKGFQRALPNQKKTLELREQGLKFQTIPFFNIFLGGETPSFQFIDSNIHHYYILTKVVDIKRFNGAPIWPQF